MDTQIQWESKGKNKVPQNCVFLNWAEQLWFVYIIVCRSWLLYLLLIMPIYTCNAYIWNIQFGIHTPFFWCVSHVLMTQNRPHQPYKKIRWENSECNNNNVYGFFLSSSFSLLHVFSETCSQIVCLFCSFPPFVNGHICTLIFFGPLLNYYLFRRKTFTDSNNNGKSHQFNLIHICIYVWFCQKLPKPHAFFWWHHFRAWILFYWIENRTLCHKI